MPAKTELDEKAKILVVNGSVAEIELISQVLSSAGYQVVARKDSAAAIDAFATEHPDLVLLDSDMPKMSGIEICKKLKGQAEKSFVAIMMLPAAPGMDELVRAVRLGADDFFRRPFYPPELVARVRAGLLTRRVHDELAASKQRIKALQRAKGARSPAEQAPESPSDQLDVLRERFGSLLAQMQTAKARRATRTAFNASPVEMGRAAVKAARRRG